MRLTSLSVLTFVSVTLPVTFSFMARAAETTRTSDQVALVEDELGMSPFHLVHAVEETPAVNAPIALPEGTQWLVFQTDWCGPCRAAKADFIGWMQASGWQVDESETAHVRLVNGDRNPQLVAAYRVSAYPTFVLIQQGKEIERYSPYPGRWTLANNYIAAVERSRTRTMMSWVAPVWGWLTTALESRTATPAS